MGGDLDPGENRRGRLDLRQVLALIDGSDQKRVAGGFR
jgi:hypothetical protein